MGTCQVTQHHLASFQDLCELCVHMKQGNGLCLHRTSLCRKIAAELKEKLVAFLPHVIGHIEKKNYLCNCYVAGASRW